MSAPALCSTASPVERAAVINGVSRVAQTPVAIKRQLYKSTRTEKLSFRQTARGGQSQFDFSVARSLPSRSQVKCHNSISGIERQTFETREEIETAIQEAIGKCLVSTDLDQGTKTVGKVRDFYNLGDKLVLITTDRQSAFDRLLASVPYKGQVLNQTSAWWFENTTHIVPNAVLATPHPNVTIMRNLKVFPVEFVVRGFMTGSTDTSLWTHYKNGSRNYCGNPLAEGMIKNQRLPANIITPTTKEIEHDRPITPEDIVSDGLMTQEQWDAVSKAAMEVFAFGQAEALKRGLLLVDTKYEFGYDDTGNYYLIDEVNTPDSSRYWVADSYEGRHAQGQEPENIDKEFLRLWFRDNCDPYNDEVLPEAPAELVAELSRRYIRLYETITGEPFKPSPPEDNTPESVSKLVTAALADL
ncbi:hypothetical protein CYMTET_12957 [Cymbomonas tetramitiformis]|uniref:phosphoribosylaminoimidazolesuccinocarboxamide synthase n=1 Tax=Cymbomonas tetramitiformis TaxID=36881 RepID=A0AAE0GJE0_9CHLO|nr:hypothetical protein CYMTET_12957 [Cymbomonas tetramitiformis]